MRKTLAKKRRESEKRVRELEMHIAALEGQQKELARSWKIRLFTKRAVARWRSIANSRRSLMSWSA